MLLHPRGHRCHGELCILQHGSPEAERRVEGARSWGPVWGPGPHLASRKRERRIMTASQVLCLSCIWMALNFRWMMLTMRSISLGATGRVRLCSLSRFMTWVVNSLHACSGGRWPGEEGPVGLEIPPRASPSTRSSVLSSPARTSPAPSGKCGGSGQVCCDSPSVRWSCQGTHRPPRLRRLQLLPLSHPLSRAQPHPPPEACCPSASAVGPRAPPLGSFGC